MIPAFGWRSVFYIGAVAPLVVAVVLALWLPESVRFLLARNKRHDEVRRTLDRIMPGAIRADAEFVTAPDPARQGVPVKHLFTEGRAIPTALLWVPFFMVFMILVTVTFWTPAVLNSVGFSLSAAALIVGLNNLGSACASALSGWLVHRFGAYRMLIPGFIVGGLCLVWFGQATSSVLMLATASFLAGAFVGGTGTGLIACSRGRTWMLTRPQAPSPPSRAVPCPLEQSRYARAGAVHACSRNQRCAAGSREALAWISSSRITTSGVLARAIPHSVAIPDTRTCLPAAASRFSAPSTPSAACTTPR